MHSSLVPQTLVNNLNFSIDRMSKLYRHLQTGKRVVHPSDDPAALSVNAKLNMSRLGTESVRTNLQNTVSFLQVQEGQLNQVGSILSQMSELHTMQSTQFATNGDRENYNKEFKELQSELQDISKSKFNGISLFSDQMPKTLFGDALATEILHPGTHESQSENTMNVTRWGIYRALSDKIQAGDKFPSEFGEKPSRDVLAFAISDEASGGSYFDDATEEGRYMKEDIDSWKDFIGERNIDGKIALIAVQAGGWGTASTPEELIPKNGYIPEFSNVYEDYPRDMQSGDTPLPPSQVVAVNGGLTVLQNAFLAETSNGTDLPAAIGVFIDDTGSVNFEEVDDAAFEFMNWVSTNFPSVAVSSKTDGGQWTNGVYSAVSERWIEQGRLALGDMMDNDPVIKNAVSLGTLDNDKSGVKGLLDDVYNLQDFDMSEMIAFQEKLTGALAVNGAESQRAHSELDHLAGKFTNLERAQSRSEDVDIAEVMTKFSAIQAKTQLQSQLIKNAEDTYIHLADLL